MAVDKLLSPINFGAVQLPNRVIMAPLTRSRTPDQVPGKMQQEYYSQRAGAGLIISEATNISESARGYVYTPSIFTDEQEAGWKGVVDAVHDAGGRMALQLWHVGRVGHEMVHPDGRKPVAPSALAVAKMSAVSKATCWTAEPSRWAMKRPARSRPWATT